VVYYPTQEDSNSEYTIRSLDVNELLIERRHQTDYLTTDSPSNSKFGSPDSDMDDGASTPSTNEPADKNFPSLLSGRQADLILQAPLKLTNSFLALRVWTRPILTIDL